MPECIHGLEIPLCDVCYPKEKPVVPRPAKVTAPRTPRGAAVSSRRSVAPATQRVYHVTHLRNLAGILRSGELRARAESEIDLSTPLSHELRTTAEAMGSSVADFVPFSLSPDAAWWVDLRDGALDQTRWSDAARAAVSTDFVFLVTTLASLGPDVVLTDGDAAATFTRFAAREDRQRMLDRLHSAQGLPAAEALAPRAVAFSTIQLIGVANDRIRDTVRTLTSTKVAVYPPWFQ